MTNKEIRVRFAPSPTGFLHVGGARTAIFNWLYAKNKGGKFLLRIEDTDPQRSKGELSKQIIRSLKWLGMESDEPVTYQSDGIKRYREVIEKLIAEKKAYYCFETEEELTEKRKEAQLKKIAYKYDRAALQMTNEQTAEALEKNLPRTVRFLVPPGETRFNDLIHGETVFQNSEIDDFVLLRSDGSPVYHIAVVVDDHEMKITHVIRGDDHLSNTPKQILLYNALNWELPEFSHLPMILDEQKRKLSKRRNPVAVEEYRDKGYLPDALFNFLTLLGFAPSKNSPFEGRRPAVFVEGGKGDDREILSRDELVKIFSLERVNKKSAVFDMKKLNWVNSEYIRMADENTLAEMLIEKGISKDKAYVIKVIKLMKERVNTVNDFLDFGRYFFEDPVSYDEKGLEKYWDGEAKNLLREYLAVLDRAGGHVEFSQKEEEKRLRDLAEKKGVKAASLIHPLRLALTGHTVSPGIFEVIELLGSEIVTRRIKKFIESYQ